MNSKRYLQNFYELIEESDEELYIMSEDDIEETEVEDLENEDEAEEAYEEETIYAPFGPNGPVIRYRSYTIEDLPEKDQ